jgi:ABC-type lipoprotein release transport system permease subunit
VFELSLLSSYIRPQKGRWSNSLLALLATGVIALVVWLVIVFFSVTEGLEQGWVGRLTTLHGQVRITPSAGYFWAYGTQVQSWSEKTNWRGVSIPRQWRQPVGDPYDANLDGELPPELEQRRDWPGAFPVESLQEALKQAGLTEQALPFQASLGVLQLQGAAASWTQPVVAAAWEPRHPSLSKLLLEEEAQIRALMEQPSYGHWPLILPRAFRDAGAQIGDRGTMTYSALGGGGVQERKLLVRLVGFYDAGVMPVGGRIGFVPIGCVEQMGSGLSLAEAPSLQGIQLHGLPADQVAGIKTRLIQALERMGAASAWKVESYRELDFAQELFQQFQSDRLLFSLIAIIVLAVACANIISFLVLLVHEKRREIGILRAMGASTLSLAGVFGGAGMALGLSGSCLGTLLAMATLANLDHLVAFLSAIQGHPAFAAAFFGGQLPNEMSISALRFVWITTPLLAFGSGLIPAWRACRLQPSAILKSE